MTKLIAMTTAATLALSSAAFAQDAQQADTAKVDVPATAQTETRTASTKAASGETIMHSAEKAGIVSMDGGQVDTNAPEAPQVAETDETENLQQEQVLEKARDMFAAADTNRDDILTADEFVAALRPVADALEADAEPVMAEMDVPTPTSEAASVNDDEAVEDAEATELAQAETVEAELETEPQTELRQVEPSDYLVAKFKNISGVDEELSLEEFESAEQSDFAAADANGDAVLTDEELGTYASLKTGRSFY